MLRLVCTVVCMVLPGFSGMSCSSKGDWLLVFQAVPPPTSMVKHTLPPQYGADYQKKPAMLCMEDLKDDIFEDNAALVCYPCA